MELKVNVNANKIESLESYRRNNNSCNHMVVDSVFVIQKGSNNEEQLIQHIKDLDHELTSDGTQKKGYFRIEYLDSYVEEDEKAQYLSLYSEWIKAIETADVFNLRLPFRFEELSWEKTYKTAFLQISKEYLKKMGTEIKLKNFMVIMFHWINNYFPKIFLNTVDLSQFPKFVYIGPIRTNEFLFFRLLALCGCDVYAINTPKELDIKWDNISFIAQIIDEAGRITTKFPSYDREQIIKTPRQQIQSNLSYEEIAGFASSIVMITVLDENRQPFATGSGVLINEDGYLLTNFHVVAGGSAFDIRLEEEEETCYAAELIKYHSSNDLALLRMEAVKRKAIPLYSGKSLVRGQKVVAIGSPLGLFNTVSDGIIAGFRNFDQVSMIQFTAPISHGSSGGALLNLCGQLIGIVTAGFNDGQNLNLAVDYDTVGKFLRGFI